MSDQTYNGWKGDGTKASAYATWRVALEMFDGQDPKDFIGEGDKPRAYDLANYLREYVNDYVDTTMDVDHTPGLSLIVGWVSAFLDDVNWDEIAENMLSDWKD